MTEDARQLKRVQGAIEAVIAAGVNEFRPGDVASYQRSIDDPIPLWELRGLFTVLAEKGLIEVDAATGGWRRIDDAKSAAAS